MAKDRMLRCWPILLASLVLLYIVGVVFWPITGFSFISLDVDLLLVDNPSVHGLAARNIKHILTAPCIQSYYPVRSLTLAFDYEIWGLNPAGFKLTGGLIHLSNVLLVFWLIARLLRYPAATDQPPERQRVLSIGEVTLAAFCAGLFAVHPLVVEPVVWVAGREELLMTLGALGCIHFHMTARRLSQDGGRSGRAAACFVAAAICCVFGCLSNAVGAIIPLLITAWDVLALPKPKLGKILRGTLVLWVIGAATYAVKALLPSGPQAELPWEILARQPGVVLVGYWLNLKTLAWPTNLALSYVFISPDNLPVIQVALGAVAAAATCVLVWMVRRRRRILFGLLWFCLALIPVSQLMPHHLQRADRYLYLPLVGIAMAVAMVLWHFRHLVKGRVFALTSAAAGAGLLFLMVTLGSRQVQRWRNDVTLWEHCVTVAPNDARPHGYLASAYEDMGQMDRAAESYRKAIELEPNYIFALNNFAICLTSGHTQRLHDHLLAVELAERGCRLTDWLDAELTHTLARAHTTLANTYESTGQHGLAIDHFCKAIEANPEYDMPLFNLSLVLSTCPDQNRRDPEMAVRFAERGLQLAGSQDAHRLSILATAYGEVGRFEDAIAVLQRAIEAAPASGDAIRLMQLNENLRSFEKRVPLTASSLQNQPEDPPGGQGTPED